MPNQDFRSGQSCVGPASKSGNQAADGRAHRQKRLTGVPEFTAEIDHYNAYGRLISAFRDRVDQRRLALSSPGVAEVSGLPAFYLNKLLQPNPIRRIGMISLGPLLAVLGLKIILTEDEEAVKRFDDRLPKSKLPAGAVMAMLAVRCGPGKHQLVSVRQLRKMAPLGGVARSAALSPRRRSQIARIAARARWQKREAKREAERAARKAAAAEAV